MKRLRYIGVLLLSLFCLGLTLFVLLWGESSDVMTNLDQLPEQSDSLKEAWVMVKDSLFESREGGGIRSSH